MGITISKPGKVFQASVNFNNNLPREIPETVEDTLQPANQEILQLSGPGILPSSQEDSVSADSLYASPLTAMVVVATIFLAVSTIMFALLTKKKTQQQQRRKARSDVTVEEKIHSIPLYSLNKPKSHFHPSSAKWNIDLLNEVDLEA